MSAEHVAALKEARKLIENDSQKYVCCALEVVDTRADSPAGEIRREIRRGLGDGNTLYGWLLQRDDPRRDERSGRALRLEWIDAMIAYYEGK